MARNNGLAAKPYLVNGSDNVDLGHGQPGHLGGLCNAVFTLFYWPERTERTEDKREL